MERGQVTFDEVAVYFSEEEWRSLRDEQKSLYKEVMNDNYQMILSLNRPDLITNIALGCEPYITTARDGAIQDSWHGERSAASGRRIFQESIDNPEPTSPPKRQRRYPRVNPFRWIKRHKKSKSRFSRTTRRSEQRENGNIEESDYETPRVRGDDAGDSREEHSELSIEREIEKRSPQTEDGNRTSKDGQSSRTVQIMGTKYKPDLRVTLSNSEEDPGSVAERGEGIADLEHYTLHAADFERATSSSVTTRHNTDHGDRHGDRHGDGHTQSRAKNAASSLSSPETTDHLNEERHQEKTRMDSTCEGITLPRKKVKHVQFSDTVTTFIIESEEAEMAEKAFFDSIRLQRKIRPRVVIVSKDIKTCTTAESIIVTQSQDSKPKATQPERKTTAVHYTLERGSQDLKSPNSMKCNKTVRTTEDVGGSLPSAVCRRNTAGPSPSTGPQLQPKDRDERSMVTRSQGSKPNATHPEWKTTKKRDTPERGSQDLKSPNSVKCNKIMKTTMEVERSPPRAVCRAEPSPTTGPPLRPKDRDEGSMVTRSQDSKPKATQPKQKTTTERNSTEGGSRDLKSPNSVKCNKIMKTTEEPAGSPPSAVCRTETTGPPLQPNRDEESSVTKSQDSKPSATQPKQKTTTERDSTEEGSRDLKSPNSVKCNKIMKTTEEPAGSPPSEVCRTETVEPSPSTGPPLQPKNRDEESFDTKSQDSKPSATHPKQKTTTERDSTEGESQDLMSPNSVKCNKIMKTTEEVAGSPPVTVCRTETAEPSPPMEPPIQPNRDEESFVTKSLDSKPSATQPERETTAVCDLLGGGSRDLNSQNSIKCNMMTKTMEEVEGSPPSAVCGSDTTKPSAPTEPQLPPTKRDVGTQIDLFHKEELQQPASHIQLTPQNPDESDQNFMKSYSCSNCGKITHWTRLNDQQKADVEKSSLHFCRMCSRQRDKSAFSPDKDTQNTTPTKWATPNKNGLTGSPARKRPHCLLLDDSPDTSSPAKKKQRQDVKGDAETTRSSTHPNSQPKKGEEASLRTPTSHNVQLKKAEASPRTSSSHNIQLKKAEASPRTSSSLGAQLKKGEGASLRTSSSHSVQLKKGEEASPKTSANPNAQLKKGEASPRTSTSDNVQLKKGEEPSLGTSTSHSVQLKKGEKAPPKLSTNHNVQLKKGEKASPKPSTNHNVQLKKGEASPRTSTNHSSHLKKGEEASPRTPISHNVQLKKSEEESQRTKTNSNVQLNKGEEESPRTSTNQNAQLKKNTDDNNKMFLAAENAHTDNNSNLCNQCRHCEAPEDAKLHHKVKTSKTATRSSSTKVLSNPDPKNDTPEKRKSNQILQNKPSPVQEQKLPSDSKSNKGTTTPQDQKNGAQTKKDACGKCGKLYIKRQKTKPLANIQHKKPVDGGSTISTDKIQKLGTKFDAVKKKQVKKSLGEPKVKKPRNAEGTKSPKSPRGARDKDLCTKCGKRLALHVAPSQDGPSEGGNDENECVVLPRKKRKRRLAGMEPFTCDDCGKIFTRNFTLLQHRLIHTGERPYSCKVCRKTFRDSSYLIVHMRSHTKEKPYVCLECGKCFSQNSALHVHSRTHTHERPFKCECGKNFTDRSTYRHHQRIHTGEKPYACSYCGKKFTQQPHMKRHETIHTGERPFECLQCGKRFIERTKLQKHERVHQRAKEKD